MIRYIINLDQSVDRWNRVSKIFENLNLEVQRISAVDGRKKSAEELKSMRPPFEERHFWLKEMTPGEIGCYLSHVKAWKSLLETEEEWALIMEDDLTMRENALEFISDDSWIPDGVGLIQVTAREPSGEDICERKTLPITGKSAQLVNVIHWNYMGTLAYMINRETARKCLEISHKIIGPIDDILFLYPSPARKFSIAWGLAPAAFFSNDEIESTVGLDKKNNKTPVLKNPMAYFERKGTMFKHKIHCCAKGVKVVR